MYVCVCIYVYIYIYTHTHRGPRLRRGAPGLAGPGHLIIRSLLLSYHNNNIYL